MEIKLFKRLIEQYVNAWTVLACDVAVSTVASCCVLFFVQVLNESAFGSVFSFVWVIAAALMSLLMFVVMRTYRTIVRYSTFHDVGRICLAIAGKDVLLFGIIWGYMAIRGTDVDVAELAALSLFDLVTTTFFLLLVRIVICL